MYVCDASTSLINEVETSLDHMHHVCTSFAFTSEIFLMLIINTSQNGNG